MNIVKLTAVALVGFVVLTSAASLRAADEAAAPPATSPTASALRFYGPITALDKDAKTFTVGEQTFCIVGDSQLTKSDDSPATLDDAKVGEPARGTYAKSADGKLNVTKVRFGKKTGGKTGGKSGGKKTTDGAAATHPTENQ